MCSWRHLELQAVPGGAYLLQELPVLPVLRRPPEGSRAFWDFADEARHHPRDVSRMPRNMIVLDKHPIVPISIGGILIYPYPTSQEPLSTEMRKLPDIVYLFSGSVHTGCIISLESWNQHTKRLVEYIEVGIW